MSPQSPAKPPLGAGWPGCPWGLVGLAAPGAPRPDGDGLGRDRRDQASQLATAMAKIDSAKVFPDPGIQNPFFFDPVF